MKQHGSDINTQDKLRFQKCKTPATDFHINIYLIFLKHPCTNVDPDQNCTAHRVKK